MTTAPDQLRSLRYGLGTAWIVPTLLMTMGLIGIAFAVFPSRKPEVLPYATEVRQASAAEMKGKESPPEDIEEIDKLEMSIPGQRHPVVQALIARETDGRVVSLNWQNNVTEPILGADLTTNEVGRVTKAIRDHVPADAVVLSWWDLSRKIRLLSERNAPLDDPLARGLLVPASWQAARPLIESRERAYWGAAVPEQEAETFSKFIDALLLGEKQGAQALAALAPGKTTYVAVHLSDVWKVATERPESFAISSKDFPGAASHGVMRTASQWLKEQNLDAAYAVEPIGNAVRVHYLPNPADGERLIAKLLPFTSSNPALLTHLALVYQHRGFWIYKLHAGAPQAGG